MWYHWHVNNNSVTYSHAEGSEDSGKLGHFITQLGIRESLLGILRSNPFK